MGFSGVGAGAGEGEGAGEGAGAGAGGGAVSAQPPKTNPLTIRIIKGIRKNLFIVLPPFYLSKG
jgi:hypothetical protein